MINSFLRGAIIILITFCFNIAWSQNPTPNQEFKPQEVTLPKSPAVIGLFDYSPFPVDHSSGSANIDIPLYTINSGRIKIPISASYHTGGIRVQDIASMIGLGWNLNFGYCVKAQEEETKIYPYSTKIYKSELAALGATYLGNSWMKEMVNSADGYYTSSHTIYDFNCGTFSGSFYYDDNDQLQLLTQNDNLKIEAIHYMPTASLMGGFKITTAEGIEYVFDQRETTMRQEQSYPGPAPQTTAFWVSKITDLISGDVVQFNYNQKDPYSSYENETYSRVFQGTNGAVWFPEQTMKSIPFQVKSLQIASIAFTGGHVNFLSANDRMDIDKRRITAMQIYSNVWPNVNIKTIQFNQSYFVSAGNIPAYNYRLRLDSLTFSSSETLNNPSKNTYQFEYDGITLPPYREMGSNEHNNYSVDYWGFYNGNSGGNGLIPKKVLQDFFAIKGWNYPLTYSTDRNANPSFTKACVLKKVTYPTGGYAQFEYENHQLPGYYLGTTLGGLRVKSIRYFADPNDIKPIEKTFNYISSKQLTPASSDMFLYNKDKTYVYNSHDVNGYQIDAFTFYQMYYISSNPCYSFVYHHGSPVFYDKVEEFNGSITKNEGKTLYKFRYLGTDHNDYVLSSIKEYGGRRFVHTIDRERGQLLSKEVYKKNSQSSTSYEKILKEINTYKGYYKGKALLGLMISKNDHASVYLGSNTNYCWDLVGPEAERCYLNKSNNGQMPKDAFIYNDITFNKSYTRLSKKETYRYKGTDSLYTYTNYYYDSPYHEQLTKLETNDSYGNINTNKYYYVQDDLTITDVNSNESGTAFPLLKQYNKLNDIIQEDQLINGKLQVRKRAKYTFRYNATLTKNTPVIQHFTTKYYNPQEVITQASDIKFNTYDDHSLLLEQQDGEGILQSYIWDDAGINLIANVANASYADIYQTSFEYGGKGKWTYNGSGTYDSSAVTGTNTYTLDSSHQLNASGLTASKEYVLSYWSSNGSYTIPGTGSIVEGRVVGNWKYYEHHITGISSIVINGSGKIDEVRLFPKNGQMTSYTNTPMIGINSICDPNGKILYYSYDGLGRLILVRDLDKNVVKRFCYKFYDQPEDCTESYN